MDNDHAKTLDALETFIHAQEALLDRTLKDIQRLKTLHTETATVDLEHAMDETNDPAFRLSGQTDCIGYIPEGVNWDLFRSRDIGPLHAIHARVRAKRHAESQPTSASPVDRPSSLQTLVQHQRTCLLEPLLSDPRYIVSPPHSSDEEEPEPMDTEQLQKEWERARLRELKKRRLFTEEAGAGGGLRPRTGALGVFVRRDVEDETAEVDIGDADADPPVIVESAVPMVVDPPTPPTAVASTSGRARRPPRKTGPAAAVSSTRSRAKPVPPPPLPEDEDLESEEGAAPSTSTHKSKTQAKPKAGGKKERAAYGSAKQGKPRAETYKQAWTLEEQHELERLLEEIPLGEKNRWQKISRAMNGRRTPRQVASRVQKYLEKLKQFGLED